MECPCCGAQVRGRFCEYCGSELIRDDNTDSAAVGNSRQALKEPPEFVPISELCDNFLQIKGITGQVFASMLMLPNGKRKAKGHKINRHLEKTLSIPEEDSIYLIHDDTLLHNGRNGFAITSSGFYCLCLSDHAVTYMSWDDFAKASKITEDSGDFSADDICIAYTTGLGDLKVYVMDLLNELKEMYWNYGQKALK